MSDKQPEALRIAAELELCVTHDCPPAMYYVEKAATELRRLHAENERLSSALKGAELGSRANFVSMQQEAVKKSELLAALKAVRLCIPPAQRAIVSAAIAKATGETK